MRPKGYTELLLRVPSEADGAAEQSVPTVLFPGSISGSGEQEPTTTSPEAILLHWE